MHTETHIKRKCWWYHLAIANSRNQPLSIQWAHNEPDGDSNHRRFDCLLNRLFRFRSKKTSKLRVTGLCGGNSPVTGGFPSYRARNAENISILWRHHDKARVHFALGVHICFEEKFNCIHKSYPLPRPYEQTVIYQVKRPFILIWLCLLVSCCVFSLSVFIIINRIITVSSYIDINQGPVY